MESFLNRYRNITVLLLVIFAQLILLAVQVKNDQDVRVIRVWTVTAVMPVARVMEAVRGTTVGFMRNYIMLHDADAENRRLRTELGRLKIDNIYLKNELNTAERAKALQVFQARTPSKMLAATVIGAGAGGGKVVFVDTGSASGVERGMAVVTPDGIVGKVIAAYPTATEVMLVTDLEFAAGVVSQKNGVRGTLKGQGTPTCKLDYVPSEEKIEVGEMLYTSGDDRVFPRGFPAGVVKVVRNAQPFKEILVEPTGLQRGLEDVLIVVEGVHQDIPSAPATNQQVYIGTQPPSEQKTPAPTEASQTPPAGTEADKLRSAYKAVGEAENHTFGEGLPGSKPPDFTKMPMGPIAPVGPPGTNSGAARPAVAPPANPGAARPTGAPTANPGAARPAGAPTANPGTARPAVAPTANPGTTRPAGAPTANPGTARPTGAPTANPGTARPAGAPTANPGAAHPTGAPTANPGTARPTGAPTANPGTARPTGAPTANPGTARPAGAPTANPGTARPTGAPTANPGTARPAGAPTANPGTASPSGIPAATQPAGNKPAATAAPGSTQPAVPRAAPAATDTKAAPATKPPPSPGAPAKQPESQRKANQAAGAGPAGPEH